MLLCFSKCKKKTESKTQRMEKANERKINFLLNCAVFDSKKRYLSKKRHEARGLLSSIDLKAPFKQAPMLADILF